MINIDAALRERRLRPAMLLSVHDEIVFEVPPEELASVKNLVKEIMEGIWGLKVPLKVNVVLGSSWAEAH